ncbi:DUF1707 SHOCT-like domain-containing protein [Micromonospora psammae]|uniref:DUF1707 SHOCT-like domain-containing protein n=1 Tax=Micromonospora sp. CPCC 205556 TaxID=3122398 RepID=UPI002FF26660
MDVQLRASDDDRHQMVAELQRHTAAGRLSLDEFSERVAGVWTARTLGDLAALTRDLPAPDRMDGADVDGSGRRELLLLFAVAAATLLLLGLFMALTR